MANQLKKNIVTPPGIGSYVAVLEPKPDPQGKLKYSLALLIPKSRAAELKDIQKAINEVAQAKWGTKAEAIMKAAKYPTIRDGDAKVNEEGKVDPIYKGHYYLSLRTDKKPQVWDAKKQPVFTDEDVYSGCLVRCGATLFAYEQSGNRGVALGLNSLQVLEKRDRLDGRSTDGSEFSEWTSEADPLG